MRLKWPGFTIGVRAPETGETPLSWSEVAHGVKARLLVPAKLLNVEPDEVDDAPIQQVWKGVGTWERRNAKCLAPAHVWEGLA